MPSDLLRHGRRPSGSDEWGAFPGRDALRARATPTMTPTKFALPFATSLANTLGAPIPVFQPLSKYPESPGSTYHSLQREIASYHPKDASLSARRCA